MIFRVLLSMVRSAGSIALISMATVVVHASGSTRTDPAWRHAWGENIGFLDAGVPGHEVTIHFDGEVGWLSGWIWSQTTGWTRVSSGTAGPFGNDASGNWGLNMDAHGRLRGYAWGENIGWINFDHPLCDAAVNVQTGSWHGKAWGENVGWLNLGDGSSLFGVRTLAFDLQPLGTPNWWLHHHGVLEGFDEGDGVSAAQEYVMDTNPNDPSSRLLIRQVEQGLSLRSFTVYPTSTRRYYTLVKKAALEGSSWTAVPTQTGIAGQGGDQVLQDADAAPRTYYSVRVSLTP